MRLTCNWEVVFIVAVAANVLISPTARWVIRRFIRRVAEEMLKNETDYKNKGEEDRIKAINAKVAEMGGDSLFGATIGVVERVIYIYALTYDIPQIIQGIIVFKAFSGWVTAGSGAQQPPEKVLGHFYGYTLGNFVSIGYAIAAFHIALFLNGYMEWANWWCR